MIGNVKIAWFVINAELDKVNEGDIGDSIEYIFEDGMSDVDGAISDMLNNEEFKNKVQDIVNKLKFDFKEYTFIYVKSVECSNDGTIYEEGTDINMYNAGRYYFEPNDNFNLAITY
jgi:hypothetical protein